MDVSIDPMSVSFSPLDGRRVARLGVAIFCGDSKNAVVGELWQEMNLALKDDSYQRYKAAGHPVLGDGVGERRGEAGEGGRLRLPFGPRRGDEREGQIGRRW